MAGPDPAGLYERYVTQAKEEARKGNLEESLKLFSLANKIHPSEKLRHRIKRVEETLAELALAAEEEEGFVDVCNSGLMIYGQLHNKLFLHQREGVAFLYSLYRDGRQGGILADDMGLGKTIQIIAFLSGMFDAELIRFVLLVMPTTLVNNWMREFAKWTPGLRVKDFHGPNKTERNRKLARIQRKNGIVITTYQMVIHNWQQLSSVGGQEFVWDYVILDEAHKIKSSSAKTTKSLYAIPAKNRILLTGTPVQNNLHEMWSLFDFACQGSLLGTAKTFKMEYENPITRAREKDATPGEKALGLKISENLMTIIQPYFLRRTKDDTQKKYTSDKVETHLPEDEDNSIAPIMPSLSRKNDLIVWVYLAPTQEEIYRNFLSLDHVKELLMTTRSPLAELNVLKKLCDHPRLLSASACSQLGLEGGGYSEEDNVSEEGAFSGANEIDHISDELLIEESGKLLFLMGLLKRLQEEGHKTLIFSQSRKMLDILERILMHRNFRTMRIDGTVTHLAERERRIALFQGKNDFSVFLLTTQVGGVGINLTAASRVVIFDPSWNPATDAQAVDRAYRIGQKENVVIYRLITCGTVEEKIYRRQVFKESLIRQTTGDKKNPCRYFTKQELRELFTLGDTRTSATQIQLQSLHAAQRKTDMKLDEHIAYLHSLHMFGISDHDLMYTLDIAQEQAENEEAHQYIQQRVQKAQELVQLESQLKDQLMGRIKSDTEGAWLRQPVFSSQPRKESPEFNNSYFTAPSDLAEPTNEDAIDLTEDENVANVSGRMTSLVIVDSEEEKLAQDASNMDINESPTISKELKESNMQVPQQKLDPNFISPSFGIQSFVNKDSHGPESQRNTHGINDLQITSLLHSRPPFNGSIMSDEAKRQRNAEMSFNNLEDDGGNENPELTSPVISKSLSNLLSEFPNRHQNSPMSEMSLEGTSVTSCKWQADFNLVLEDSEEQQNVSKMEKSLEHTENTDFGSSCNVAMGNLNDSLQVSEGSMESGGVRAIGKKKLARRILSDSEEENSVMILNENLSEETSSPLNSPLHPSLAGISSSTPKCDRFQIDPIFNSRGNTSTASRRSLINVVLDQVEDIEEAVGAHSQTEDSDEVQEDLVEEEAEEHSVESVEPEEEPAGETLDTEGSTSYLEDTAFVTSKEDATDKESPEELTDPELLSGEQMDYFSKESAGLEGDGVTVDSLHAPDNYDALVDCGKKLKDNGKLQDALNCFLQALDIKNGDPEVMLITLNVYKQLSQQR